jgi:hypothetical protein
VIACHLAPGEAAIASVSKPSSIEENELHQAL